MQNHIFHSSSIKQSSFLKDALWAVNKELLAGDLHKEQRDQAEVSK